MTLEFAAQMVFGALGGLGLFLIGMKQMSEGMQAVAGERLRRMISTVTDNRFIACGVGTSVTALIQSSSVTTVMVVGMVNAGVMTLQQAIGVILGADIGTTITAWLVALKVSEYGLVLIGLSSLFYLFSKTDRVRYTAMMVLGLGFVFFGLQLMKEGFSPLREMEGFVNMLAAFRPDTLWGLLKCIAVGSFVTAVIQSSSATVAITITLAMTGAIDYETAIALVLGENIGTTITAFLASLGASTNAKRAAYAHISIKVLGVLLLLPLFPLYLNVLEVLIPPDAPIAARIAFAHSGFNILIVSVFIWAINPLSKLVTFIAPGARTKEHPHLTYLNTRIYDSPAIGVQQSHSELVRMSAGVREMLDWLGELLANGQVDQTHANRIFKREKLYDRIQKEIVEYIGALMGGNLSHSVSQNVRMQLRIVDEYESISDEVVVILKLLLRLRNDGLHMTDEGKQELLDLHGAISRYIDGINVGVREQNDEILLKAMTQGDEIRRRIKSIRASHLNRLGEQIISPLDSLVFMDVVSAYRRIKDHILNIAEALAGEK
ncbi:MAG: sodium:phosphate symporter [Ignavibacteria bacterium]|nr:MAG: sodium:phosphate symporter [Ignavibacteria bacterium]